MEHADSITGLAFGSFCWATEPQYWIYICFVLDFISPCIPIHDVVLLPVYMISYQVNCKITRFTFVGTQVIALFTRNMDVYEECTNIVQVIKSVYVASYTNK